MKKNEVVWGVIGAGNVCEKKSTPAMNKILGSRIKSVMRRNSKLAKDFASRHGIPFWYDRYEDLLSDPEIDIIYIATPPVSHAEICSLAAEAGKNIYVEKPMANSYQECLDMINVCKTNQVDLYVAYYRRYLEAYVKIKESLKKHEIGDISEVKIKLSKPIFKSSIKQNWRYDNNIGKGGLFYDLASHQIDMLDFLFGEIESVKGKHKVEKSKRSYLSEHTSADFYFKNGIKGSGEWIFNQDIIQGVDHTIISGSKGKIEFGTFAEMFVRIHPHNDSSKIYTFERPQHIQYGNIEAIVKGYLNNQPIESNAKTAAHTNWIMEQITKN